MEMSKVNYEDSELASSTFNSPLRLYRSADVLNVIKTKQIIILYTRISLTFIMVSIYSGDEN